MQKHYPVLRPCFRALRSSAFATMVSFSLATLLFTAGCNKTAAPPPDATATTPAAIPASAPPPPPTAAAETAAAPSNGTPAPATPPPASVMTAAPPVAGRAPEKMAEAPPPPKQYTVPAGTRLAVRVTQTISAKNSNVGDSFSGVLAQSVVVRGVSVIRAGAPVSGTVVAAKGQGRFKGSGALGIAVRRVGTYAVSTSSYEADTKGKGKRTATFIGGGGGGGALIGGLAGGGKGALIGGLLGAGAGTAGAAFTGNKDVTIPAETVVSFSLSDPITVVEDRSKRTDQ